MENQKYLYENFVFLEITGLCQKINRCKNARSDRIRTMETKRLRKQLRSGKGSSLVEYSLLVSLVAILAINAVGAMGRKVAVVFDYTDCSLNPVCDISQFPESALNGTSGSSGGSDGGENNPGAGGAGAPDGEPNAPEPPPAF